MALSADGLTLAVGSTSVFGFGVPAVIGVTPATESTFVYEDGGNTSTALTVVALSWATSPTNPSVYSRRVSCPGTIGAGISWTFPRGFGVLKAKTLTCSNIGTVIAVDQWWVIDE